MEAATHSEVETVVSASHGTTGLVATYKAIQAGKRIGLANKEVLVAAGELVTRTARGAGSRNPACGQRTLRDPSMPSLREPQEVRRLILTASGGPFLKTPRKHFDRITPEEALQHPVWKMGGRITIDSATLMNKGLEIIEAHWLFGFPSQQIDVLIHPESVVHSMVEFKDGSVMAQLSVPDMRLPIQYALTYPDRLAMNGDSRGLDLIAVGKLRFAEPDTRRFPCLDLAREALAQGGSCLRLECCRRGGRGSLSGPSARLFGYSSGDRRSLGTNRLAQNHSAPWMTFWNVTGKPGVVPLELGEQATLATIGRISGIMAGSFITDAVVVVVVLGLMIFIHELGHFMAAKSFGVRVLVFSLGFGKRLLHFKRGDTDYRISALPFGGYVKMAGDDPSEVRQGDPGSFWRSLVGRGLWSW